MKIWNVEIAGFNGQTHCELFLTKEEAQNKYDHVRGYRKMYQVEDIWNWCARHFERVVNEIVAVRDNGDGFTFTRGLVNELRETAEHCGIEHFWADMIIVVDNDEDVYVYAMSVAWFYDGKLHHMQDVITGLDCDYNQIPLYKKGWELKK